MQAALAGMKAPGAWHPQKQPPHLNPCPQAPGPHFLFLHPPHPITYVADPNSNHFVHIIFFLRHAFFFFGRGGVFYRPPFADLIFEAFGAQGEISAAPYLYGLRNFKTPGLKDTDLHTRTQV